MSASQTETLNPYRPTTTEISSTSSPVDRVTPRWPTPLIIIAMSVVIGIIVASAMTTDMRPRAGQLNMALWAFTGLSLTFGSAGALFGYQYLLGHVPLWYSAVALGFFAITPMIRSSQLDSLSLMISILAACNAIVATATPWIAKHVFKAGVAKPAVQGSPRAA